MSSEQATVLMVEDSPTQSARLMYLLQSQGYSVLVTSNARDAISLSQKERPSLIVSDVTMPDMDGYEMCRELRSIREVQDIPVLLLTGLSDPEDIVNGLNAGADCYLTKPYEDADLLHRIDFVLKNRSGLQTREVPIEIEFMGKKHNISSSRHQILGLLLSTYESAASQNKRNRKELLGLKMQVKKAEGLSKLAERSALASAELLAGLATSCSEPMLLLDASKSLVWQNKAAQNHFGEGLQSAAAALAQLLPSTTGESVQLDPYGAFDSVEVELQVGQKIYFVRHCAAGATDPALLALLRGSPQLSS